MKRYYFLAYNLDAVSRFCNDCHNLGINDNHFHVLTQDLIGLYNRSLHAASFFHQSDIIHSCVRGSIVGSLSGLSISFALAALIPVTVSFLFCVVLGSFLLGSWIGGLMGLSHTNYKLAQFNQDIANGRHLIILDMRQEQQTTLLQLARYKHPNISFSGIDTVYINPWVPIPTATHGIL